MTMLDNQATRKKILLITRNFPPLLGGMERFNERVVAQLGKEFDLAVCGPAGCEEFLPATVPVSSVGIRPLPVFIVRMLFTSLRMALRFHPDVVIAGSGLTAPIALLVGRWLRAPVLVFLYGLDLVVSSRLYRWLWIPAIRACDGFLAISRHTRKLAEENGIDGTRIRIVHPGVDPLADHVLGQIDFRVEYGLGSRPILLSVGRLTRRKGLVEFIQNALPQIVGQFPDAVLVVIGGEPSDALAGNRSGVTVEARETAGRLGLESNVLLLGRVPDDVVRAAYKASQVHVFPIRDIPGDVEGFGIVALDAAVAGVPTVAFAVGGVPDAIGDGVSGALIAPGDYPAMADAVIGLLQSWPRSENDARRRACVEFGRGFEWDRIGPHLRQTVSELSGFDKAK